MLWLSRLLLTVAEKGVNSGWMVQQLTPTLCSTLVTPDNKSPHLLRHRLSESGLHHQFPVIQPPTSPVTPSPSKSHLWVWKPAWQCTWTEATRQLSVSCHTCSSCTAQTPGTLEILRPSSDTRTWGGHACSSS